MRIKWMLLVFLGEIFGMGSVAGQKWIVGPGEYQCYFIEKSTGKLYGLSATPEAVGAEGGIPETPMLVAVPPDRRIVSVASGLHHSVAADDHGNVWAWGAIHMTQEQDGQVGDYQFLPKQIAED